MPGILKLGVARRIWLLALLPLLIMTALLAVSLALDRQHLLENRKLKTRHVVEVAHGILAHYHAQEKQGLLSPEAARQNAIEGISALRYEQTEYFWINDLGEPVPKMVMHPTVPSLDGKVLSDAKFDAATSLQAGLDRTVEPVDRMNLFVAFNTVVRRAGHGYVEYFWPKPKAGGGVTEERYQKLSYVKLFEPWGWVIGSGIYIDDVVSAFWNNVVEFGSVVLLLVALLFGAAVTIIRSVTRPLSQLQETIVRIEQSGDLSLRARISSQDEVGLAAAAFDRMMQRIATLIADTRESAEAIAAAAQSMATTSAQVEKSSSAQAEAASSVAAAVEETSVSISETANNARTADETTARAREEIQKTLTEVRATAAEVERLAAMIGEASGEIGHLAESSRQIDGIVKTIKDIADQTNLLALNAAIEAARAGEQGRGFAVVADEVRKLAEKTSAATSEISTLIGNIQSEIDGAVSRMEQANGHAGTTRSRVMATTEALDAASADTLHVTEAVRSIADAVREQDSAVQQIAQRVERIAQMTDENTAASAHAAETARHLDTLAGRLRASVGQFRV